MRNEFILKVIFNESTSEYQKDHVFFHYITEYFNFYNCFSYCNYYNINEKE